MLADEKLFAVVEDVLTKNGAIARFEAENGPIRGRMMIMRTVIPEGIEYKRIAGKMPTAFEASFDFYDAAVGLALDTVTMQAATGVWVTPQAEGAEAPAREWIDFFVEKLMGSFNSDGSYGTPVYSFVTDTCDMTVVPTAE